MKNYLILDTSISYFYIAIAKTQEHSSLFSIKSRFSSETKKTLQLISIYVEELLIESKISLQEIDTIIISRGPGSFTGIKVGLAFLYGLQVQIPRCPIIPYDSLVVLTHYFENLNKKKTALLFPITKVFGYIAFSRDHPLNSYPFILNEKRNPNHHMPLSEYILELKEYQLFTIRIWPEVELYISKLLCEIVLLTLNQTLLDNIFHYELATLSKEKGETDRIQPKYPAYFV